MEEKMNHMDRSYSILTINEFAQIFNNISRILYHCIEREDFTAGRWEVKDPNFIREVGEQFGIKYKINYMFYIPAHVQADKVNNFPASPSIRQIVLFVDDEYGTADAKFRKGIFSDSESTIACIIPSKIIVNRNGGEFYREVDIMYSLFMSIMENTFTGLSYKPMERIADYLSRLLFNSDSTPEKCVRIAVDNFANVADMSSNYIKIAKYNNFSDTLTELIYAEEEDKK